MKRFALLIAAVLFLAGCSSNSPVAPGDTIYNVTGGEALFKVELKDYPLVVDSIPKDSNSHFFGGTVFAHIDIPVSFKIDSASIISYQERSSVFFIGDELINQYTFFGGEIKNVLIVDSLFRYIAQLINGHIEYVSCNNFFGELTFTDGFRFNIQMNCYFDSPSVIDVISKDEFEMIESEIISRLNAIKNKSWFTFKIAKLIYYKP